MDTQLQQKAVRVTKGLSAIVRSASARINASQQTILAQEVKREEEKKRLLGGRLARARSGLRRFLEFAGSRSIQRLVKMNELVNGKGQYLPFYELRWDLIGNEATSLISFSIGSRGIMITMTNTCWRRMDVSAIFPYKGSVVTVKTEFASRHYPEWTSSTKDVLNLMATGEMSSFNEIGDESIATIRVLGSWIRPAPFEKIATAFLEGLEQRVESELKYKLRNAE